MLIVWVTGRLINADLYRWENNLLRKICTLPLVLRDLGSILVTYSEFSYLPSGCLAIALVSPLISLTLALKEIVSEFRILSDDYCVFHHFKYLLLLSLCSSVSDT